MKQKFPVELDDEQYAYIKTKFRGGKMSVLVTTRMRILLLADKKRSNYTDIMIVKSLGCSHNTVKNIRKKFFLYGLEAALNRKKQTSPSRKAFVDVDVSTKIIALACSKGENGAERWSLRRLSNKLVELKIVDQISYETVRKVLKKMT
jgi:hypothetical protein